MDAANSSRLELAQALRELADGSSEVTLRNALSRSYYSIFHAANVLLDRVTHEDIVEKLEKKFDAELAERVKKLRELRSQADYDPNLVEREYKGDLENFQRDARDQIGEGLAIFNRIMGEIERDL